MKFKFGLPEFLIGVFVVLYFVCDIIDITQYSVLKNLNTSLLNSLLVPLFVLVMTLYYNYSIYKFRYLKENLDSNINTVLTFHEKNLLKNENWLYMKKQRDLGLSVILNNITSVYVTPPTIAHEGVSIIGTGSNNLVLINENIFLTIVRDRRDSDITYYVINKAILEWAYNTLLNKFESLKSDLLLLNSNLIEDINKTDERINELLNVILEILNDYSYINTRNQKIRKPVIQQNLYNASSQELEIISKVFVII